MTELDLYYRAFGDYTKAVTQDKTHARTLHSIRKAAAPDDRLEATRTRCIIDEEWIATIEKHLPLVEKAIKEERQFIRQEGETVLIEKVKKVSRDSVVHLARHSDLISHIPEDTHEQLTPDKIYMVENESNYAIYENRFLYLLLCYTRDFVDLRYTKISELGNTYRGNLRIRKHIDLGKRSIEFDAVLDEVAKNDPRSKRDKTESDLIERLETIRLWVGALLNTPLMNEVSKVAMLRPPITRTNVLRMDNNFKAAVELYDYLTAYEGDGYEIEEIKKSFSPFTDPMAKEIFEVIPLLSFLTYKYGNSIEKDLATAYQEEEERRQRERLEAEKEAIRDLRERVKRREMSLEEFLLALEERVKHLETALEASEEKRKRLDEKNQRYKAEIDRLVEVEAALNRKIEALTEENRGLAAELARTIADYEARIVALREEHEAELLALCEEHKAEIAELTERHATEIAVLEEAHRDAMEAAAERHRSEMTATAERHRSELDATIARYTAEAAAVAEARTAESTAASERIASLTETVNTYRETEIALRAELHARGAELGRAPDEDLTERERFLMLEREREWFEKMFKETWGRTKKRIRKDLLWTKPKKAEPAAPEAAPTETPPSDAAPGEVTSAPTEKPTPTDKTEE